MRTPIYGAAWKPILMCFKIPMLNFYARWLLYTNLNPKILEINTFFKGLTFHDKSYVDGVPQNRPMWFQFCPVNFYVNSVLLKNLHQKVLKSTHSWHTGVYFSWDLSFAIHKGLFFMRTLPPGEIQQIGLHVANSINLISVSNYNYELIFTMKYWKFDLFIVEGIRLRRNR